MEKSNFWDRFRFAKCLPYVLFQPHPISPSDQMNSSGNYCTPWYCWWGQFTQLLQIMAFNSPNPSPRGHFHTTRELSHTIVLADPILHISQSNWQNRSLESSPVCQWELDALSSSFPPKKSFSWLAESLSCLLADPHRPKDRPKHPEIHCLSFYISLILVSLSKRFSSIDLASWFLLCYFEVTSWLSKPFLATFRARL